MAMESDGDRGAMTDLNAVGTAQYVGQRFGVAEGGNHSKGAVDQPLPTAIIARGNEVKGASDTYLKGERKEASYAKNKKVSEGQREESRR